MPTAVDRISLSTVSDPLLPPTTHAAENATMMYVSPSTGREIKAVLFDTFGSVVDWRSGVARDVAAFAERHRIDLDAAGFADAWRAKYEPSMEPIRNGSREFVPLDQLHLENLHATLAEVRPERGRLRRP